MENVRNDTLAALVTDTIEKRRNAHAVELKVLADLDRVLFEFDTMVDAELQRITNDHAQRRGHITQLLDQLGDRTSRLPTIKPPHDIPVDGDAYPRVIRRGVSGT